MENILVKVRKNIYFIILTGVYLLLQYLFFFKKGNIVLGGEGNYWTDFQVYLSKLGYTWIAIGAGMPATSLNAIFSYPLILSFIDNANLQSFIIVTSIYLLPFIFSYLLFINLNPNKFIGLLLGIFIIANPFSINYLAALNPWSVHVLFIYPLYFLIIYTFYNQYFKLFFIFGIISLIFAYTFANPPQMVLIILFLPVLLFIANLIKYKKFNWEKFIKNTLIIFLSLLIFHIWWLLHWLVVFSDTKQIYTLEYAKAWISQITINSPYIFKDIFSILWLNPTIPEFNFFNYYYNLPFIKIFLFIPAIIIFYWLISNKKKNVEKKIIYPLLLVLAIILLFLKGPNPPLGNLILYCFDHIPFCYIFKTAPEKFGVVYIFFFSLTLLFIFRRSNNKWMIRIFVFYIFILLIPFITGKYIPQYQVDPNEYATRVFPVMTEFNKFWQLMKNKKLDIRLLSLPTVGNYQVKMHLKDNLYYTGLDPTLYNIPQAFIADYNGVRFSKLFNPIDNPNHDKLLSIYNIRYILINKKLQSWFGNLTGKPLPRLEDIIKNKYPLVSSFGELNLYSNQNFLPHLYTPFSIIVTNKNADELSTIIEQPEYNIRSAIFFENSNLSERLRKELLNPPILEFKKINQSKYIIILHKVSDMFPMIFLETYHQKWKAYITKSQISNLKSQNTKSYLSNYDILDGNEGDQASKEELQDFISKGLVTALGDGKERTIKHMKYENGKEKLDYIKKYKIDFVSKNFQDTIQNDNLLTGPFWETWMAGNWLSKDRKWTDRFLDFARNDKVVQIPDENHLMVNGYANSWIIDPDEICKNQGFCIKNDDGTYDMELIVEFWPQRLFYIGLGISGMTLLSCLGYLVIDFVNKRKVKGSYATINL